MFIIALSSEAQNCNTDSIVTLFQRARGDNFYTSISTSIFDIVNGVVPPSATPFTRRYLNLNSNHDTLNYVLTKGTGSGYENYIKTDFTYDPVTNLVLSRMEYTGAGNNWSVVRSEIWNYNSNNLITDYTQTDTTGNLKRIIYSYTGNLRQSILHQIGTGTNWTNDILFNIIYTSGMRDSLLLQRWDAISSTWVDSLAAKYILTFDFAASLSDTVYPGSKTIINTFTYDTLDLLQRKYDSDSTWNGLYDSNEIRYQYINSHQVVSATVAKHNGCDNGIQYFSYDQYGVQTGETHSGHCGIGSGGSSSVVYDSSYRTVHQSLNYWSSVSDQNYYWDYYYFSSDSIILNYIPIQTFGGIDGSRCAGDSIMPNLISGGGCGPLSYLWSPSIGLSSDTSAQPIIHLSNDTIVYTITVSDTTGHSTQSTFTAYPRFFVTVTFDTTACPGCPVVLYASTSFSATYDWYRNDTMISGAHNNAYTAINSGTYYVIANTSQCAIRSDSIALTLSGLTRINGNVFWDRDSDCTYTSADTSINDFGFRPLLIGLITTNYQAFISPDSSGYYDLPIDTGTFVLKLYNLSELYSPSCSGSDSIVVHIPAYGDTLAGNNFALKGDTSCKRLEVRISSSQFRPCQPATISVWYFNGSITAENSAAVDVTIPSELNVTSATLPYIINGNTYSFNLPSLLPGESGSITISAEVFCNTRLNNATLCIDAEISPKDFCSLHPDSTWDGSNIRVNSYCNNDSMVCFTIANNALLSSGNMNSSSAWRLYANNILFGQGTFILNANSDTVLCFNSDGSTYRLEADRTPGSPGGTYVNSSIERCGLDSNSYSLHQIPLTNINNSLPFYYTYCHKISNSFDPNIKSVQPEGLGPSYYIPSGQRLKYRIDFQNTGTDTANYVEINDQLNIYYNNNIFDFSSIEIVGTSHPCHYEYNNNTFTCKFFNINLPDSSVNQLASHGYVEFTIKTFQNIANGTSFLNRAQIIFDSNSPVLTPFVRNTICNIVIPKVVISADSSFCFGQTLKCKAIIQNGGTSPLPYILWFRNGTQLSSGSGLDSLIFPSLQFNDTISCKVQSTALCAYPFYVESNKLIFNQYSIPKPTITFNSPDLISTLAPSYQWIYNQIWISGAISQTYAPINNGTYRVLVTDNNGCIAVSDPYVFFSVGVTKNSINNLVIYPNPAYDFINIEYISTITSVRIMDAIGEIVYSARSSSNSISVLLKDINQGRYLIEISTTDGKFYRPLIIFRDK